MTSQTAPIELYYWPTPNGHKISIMLEELGVPYEVRYVNIGKGEQDKRSPRQQPQELAGVGAEGHGHACFLLNGRGGSGREGYDRR